MNKRMYIAEDVYSSQLGAQILPASVKLGNEFEEFNDLG